MAGAAGAQVDPTTSFATMPLGNASIMVTPNGGGDLLASVSSRIDVYVQDVAGNAMVALVAGDFEVDAFPGTLTLSDAFLPLPLPRRWDVTVKGFSNLGGGNYRIEGSLLAGGYAQGAMVKVLGVQIGGAPLPLTVNSPDLNANGTVNLTDVSTFAAFYFSGYNWLADFNFDGVLNLVDVVKLSMAVGASFPLGYGIDPVD